MCCSGLRLRGELIHVGPDSSEMNACVSTVHRFVSVLTVVGGDSNQLCIQSLCGWNKYIQFMPCREFVINCSKRTLVYCNYMNQITPVIIKCCVIRLIYVLTT